MVSSLSFNSVATSPSIPSTKSSSRSSKISNKNSTKTLTTIITLSHILLLGLIALIPTTLALAPFEPPGNQVLFGAWLDTQGGFNDTPSKFNARIKQNVAVFQIAQDIPLPKYNYTTGAGGPAPESMIELSGTDAAVFLTVYPYLGFPSVTIADFIQLGEQILDYQENLNRTVFLRYAPEMQGTWNVYGQQPTAFNSSWHQMHQTIFAIAPQTIFVWAPNTPQGYPYGETFATSTAADIALLDTNLDGVLSDADNALDPYYPGDNVVDWIGISLYYKGPYSSDVTNVAQPAGYCSLAINGTDPGSGLAMPANWYTKYCAGKPTKACMFAESGAAYHINDGGTASQAAVQQAWISDCITNVTMFNTFPRLKMVMQFEYEKVENSNLNVADLRDYRITNSSVVLAELLVDLAPMATRFSWANIRATPTSISSPGAPPIQTNSAGQTVIQAITATTRARSTGFPTLFGTTSDGSMRTQMIELGILLFTGIVGALTVMKML